MSKKVLGLILLAIWGFSFSVVEAQSGAFFGVSPTKLEANLKSGEVSSQTITVLNKLGGPARFTLSLESFYPGKGGQGIEIKSVQDDIIRKYISFDDNSFVLADGESIIVPVSIRLAPTEIAPSAFGVISIEGKPLNAAQGAARVSSRLGVLVFINASAKAKPKGELLGFGLAGGRVNFDIAEKRSFFISYKNTGNVYVNPYGYIEAKYFGFWPIRQIEVKPWFVLPASTRTTEVVASSGLPYGPYIFSLKQNRGYQNIVDTKSLIGLLLPTRVVTFFSLLALIIFGTLVRRIYKLKME